LNSRSARKIFDRSAINQVWDYALDLKNFHEASHDASIIPIPVATEASESPAITFHEDAATEFQVQGLELDWVCVNWDSDFRFNGSHWNYHDFRGDRWVNIASPERQNYLRNAYRVLLTRARQGMVVFVPPGDRMIQLVHHPSTIRYSITSKTWVFQRSRDYRILRPC
jgi:hypothetical protein